MWMVGVFLLCFVYFLPRGGDANEDSRLDLILALGNQGHAWVDDYRWNALGDTIPQGRHYYASKQPGQSLSGLPVFFVYKTAFVLTGHGQDVQQVGLGPSFHRLYLQFYLLQFLETFFMVEVPGALFLLFFYWFLGYFSSSSRNRLILTLAVGLGTSFFSFAQGFYPHVPTAALLFAGFALIYMAGRGIRAEQPRAPRLESRPGVSALVAGLCLGCAAFFDPTAVIPGVVIGLYGLARLPARLWPYLVAGALPFLAATLAYDKIAFEDAGVSAYNTKAVGIAARGVAGAPAGHTIYPQALWGMSFSPFRGLFFVSPFLLLAFPGLVLWRRRGGWEWLACLLGPVLLYLFVSTIFYWQGGISIGPRYLVEIIPLLALPVIFVLDRSGPRLVQVGVALLFVLSFANVWVQTMTGPNFPPDSIVNPLFQVALPDLIHGKLALSLGGILVAPFGAFHTLWALLPLPILIGLWTLYSLRPWSAARTLPSGSTPDRAPVVSETS